ncbi:tetraacyldisaccharide 4'-kinase [Psychroserpens sp. SPM9]|uniref:tetraacyldisaccharide 4'-kinase n=1 Tax=Psychroserpens sp. SPM9 TaxID=2975598 RepID=UPI0021A58D88|nr:tetraacyldisaccharide 4'-kinase [Psychroserpens sp. SPM9]MDG5492800.1 tetraacyldisaccharide 4'-kinase [Psychroserpens sp. SPM9]
MIILAIDFTVQYMNLLRALLFPFVPVYYVVTWLRNKCYDLGWKSSKSYDIPILCIGNLSTGGTGKTPMTEYIVRLLQSKHELAVLSRGYGRKTKGFILADEQATAETIGDEPFQFYTKFKDKVSVAVDENRQHGIETLQSIKSPEVIVLDDAFQHRKVTAGFNILLTAYGALYSNDIVLPTGNLREPRAGAKRADCIVVTKCPKTLSENDKKGIVKQLKPLAGQAVYFSSISYSDRMFSNTQSLHLEDLKDKRISLVTGIANPKPLIDYLKAKSVNFEHLNFKDHHVFTASEIETLRLKAFILTTEKDYMRLQASFKSDTSQLWYLPIAFDIDSSNKFDEQILAAVR